MSVDAPDVSASPRLTRRLAANTLVQAGGNGVASLIGLFTFVTVTRGLGPEAFGDFTTAMAFLFIPVVLADVGLAFSVLREISASPERTQRVMSASLPLRALISMGAVSLAVALGMAIPFSGQTREAILIGSIGSFLHLLTLSLLPAIQAQLKMHWAVAANVAGRVATLGLTLSFLGAGLGFRSIVAAHVIGLALTFVGHLVVVAMLISLRPFVDLGYWRSLLRGALALGLAISLSQIYFRVDTLLLALLASSTEVGLYGAAYKFIELCALVVSAVSVSVFPLLARFAASGDPRMRGLVQKSFDLLVALSAPLAVGMSVLAPEILLLTSGSEYVGAASALRLLAPYVLFSFVNALLIRILLARGQDRTLLWLATSILTLNVALNLLMIPRYGIEAAAAISVVSEICMLALAAMAVRRLGGLPGLRSVPAVAVAAGAMSGVLLAVPGPTLVVAGIGSIVYAGVLLALPGTIRELGRGVLLSRRQRTRAAAWNAAQAGRGDQSLRTSPNESRSR